MVLREQLPESLTVSRGYICQPEHRSSFLEVIIHDRDADLWYQEGELVCLPPQQVRAVLWSVAPNAHATAIEEKGRQMAQLHNWLVQEQLAQPPFLGMWVGETEHLSFEDGIYHTIGRLQRGSNKSPSIGVAWGSWHWLEAKEGKVTRVSRQQSMKQGLEVGPLAAWLNAIHHHLLGEKGGLNPDAWFETGSWRRMGLVEQVAGEMNLPTEPVPLRVRPPHRAHDQAELWAPVRKSAKPKRQGVTAGSPNPSAQATRQLAATKQEEAMPQARSRPKRKRKTAVKDEVTPLHLAVLAVDTPALRRGLSQGMDPDAKNPQGDTPLHLAAMHDLHEMVQALIGAGADLNARNYVYASPLHLSVENDSSQTTKILLTEGAEVEVRNNRGRTPLHQAAVVGNIEAARLLLEHFADIHASMEKEMQPIHLAAWYGQNEMLEYLVGQGASLNAINSDGNSALHFAAFNNQVKAIKLLTNLQADSSLRNFRGETYLQGLNEGYTGEMIRVLD
jgi:ankyrin repeat protein